MWPQRFSVKMKVGGVESKKGKYTVKIDGFHGRNAWNDYAIPDGTASRPFFCKHQKCSGAPFTGPLFVAIREEVTALAFGSYVNSTNPIVRQAPILRSLLQGRGMAYSALVQSNNAPVANAVVDQSNIILGSTATLEGRVSSNPDNDKGQLSIARPIHYGIKLVGG